MSTVLSSSDFKTVARMVIAVKAKKADTTVPLTQRARS
jgi:hypothetical protein